MVQCLTVDQKVMGSNPVKDYVFNLKNQNSRIIIQQIFKNFMICFLDSIVVRMVGYYLDLGVRWFKPYESFM